MAIGRRQFLKAAVISGAGGLSLLARDRVDTASQFTVSTRRLSLSHTWTIARNSSDFKDNVFVRVERDGIVGWGEAAPNVRYGESTQKTIEALRSVKDLVESADWFEYVDLQDRWRKEIQHQNCACAALDMAILDWVASKLNIPLYRLFGLDRDKTPLTSFSIGIDTPQVIRRKVREAKDYPLLKIKVGRDNDREILKAVRDVTDRPLRVDANEGWTDKYKALGKIHWLEELGVELIEQPMPSDMLYETAWLRDRVRIPVIADEAVKTARDIPKLAEAYDGINIKLMKAGGLQEAMRMIHMARALGMQVMLGCMIESSVAISAAAHLSPLVDYADLDGNLLISNDPFEGVTVADGKLILSERPGLGVRPRTN